METNIVRGFKVFNHDWTCSPGENTKQYTCPGMFEEDGGLDICERRMHFCENAADCFNYYAFNPDNRVAEVIAHGKVVREGNKSCTDKLEIVREIPWDEVLRIVNIGKDCTGNRNTGNRNTGNRNTGDCNTGNCNTGDRNTGDCNTGNRNTGDCNTGNRNTGDWNTGDWNTGDRNTGDWNTGDWNTGCFNTTEQKIMMFNKPSVWTHRDWLQSSARDIMRRVPKRVVRWIDSSDMSDAEKTANPTHETTGGYLKVLDESEGKQSWWDGLSDEEKDIVMAIPNFDKEIFFQCTGIRVDKN